MKKFCFAVVFFSFLPIAFANDTAFGGSAASPMPIKTDGIAMVSENIVLRADAKRNAWNVTCDFVFQNTTDKTIELSVGMPFSTVDDAGEFQVPKGEKQPKVGSALVWDFVSKVDGKKVKAKKKPVVKNAKYPDLFYESAYIWKMKFKPKQKRNVRNTYVIGYTSDSVGQNHVDYILKTGRMWGDGKIGRSQLTVISDDQRLVFPEEPPGDYGIPTTPKGFKVKKKSGTTTITWDLKNFVPSVDLHATFYRREHIAMNHWSKSYKFEKMSLDELRKTRNAIYAIYGYAFKDKKLQKHFESQWYYTKNPKFSPKVFNTDEKEFIAEVKKWEKKKKASK